MYELNLNGWDDHKRKEKDKKLQDACLESDKQLACFPVVRVLATTTGMSYVREIGPKPASQPATTCPLDLDQSGFFGMGPISKSTEPQSSSIRHLAVPLLIPLWPARVRPIRSNALFREEQWVASFASRGRRHDTTGENAPAKARESARQSTAPWSDHKLWERHGIVRAAWGVLAEAVFGGWAGLHPLPRSPDIIRREKIS